ncbi:MAG: hypothetical protein LBH25_07970 [Fibromonadaceae bacterium]|jgi:hypothetical protein|nr:hypothetical protein [Fibromonadaceae bacterium]
MKNFIMNMNGKSIAVIFCILAFFACNEKDNDAKKLQSMDKSTNEANAT